MSSMRTGLAVAGIAVTALLGAGAPARSAVTAPQAAALGTQAYVYGFPLMEFLRVRATATSVPCPTSTAEAPVNALGIAAGFPGPQDRTVVQPNVDTLYAVAQLDLGAGPVVLGHPDMGDRYFVFQFLDPYTNTVAYVGQRTTGASAGRFAITWSGGPGAAPAGTTPVVVPSRRIWMIGRVLATDSADQLAARALMRRFTLTPPGGATPNPDCEHQPPVPAPRRTGIDFLDGLSAAMEDNPPPARDAAFLQRFTAIGVGPGRRVGQARLGPVVRAVLSRAVTATDHAMPKLVEAQQFRGALARRGWMVPPANIGDYGRDYVTRAGVAQVGLGANTPEEAAYSTAQLDVRGRRLDGRRTYALRFGPGQEPPAGAFWSLTLYDEAGFLADVPEDRHAIGSSRPGLHRRPDGSIAVVFSRERPSAPDVNWLPTPRGRFLVTLRIYRPGPSALSGAWRPPGIEPAAG